MAGIPPIQPKASYSQATIAGGYLCPLGPKVTARHRMTLGYAHQFKSLLQI